MNIADGFDLGASGEAKLVYGDADYDMVVPGDYVLCAVTQSRIKLDDLRYWNVDKQEAYRDAAAASKGFGLID